MIVNFANAISLSSATVSAGTATISNAFANSTYIEVDLIGVSNVQTLSVTLTVSDGSTTANVVVPMTVLIGDTNGNGVVNSTDVAQTKAQLGIAVSASNYREDVSANGTINSSDVALVKSLLGTSAP
jgi:hypothetical protein